jgi:sortase A
MTRGARIVLRIGLGLFAVGVLLVSFVAYQLWGTGLYEEQAQSHLKSELTHTLHHALPTGTAELTDTQRFGLPALAHQTAPTLPDPAVNDPVGLLSIPKIGINDAIVEGVGEAQLEQGPGHYPGTALPGQPGNVGIAGHRTTYAHPFYNLDALGPGDNVYILTGQGFFKYTVTGSQVVAPTDVAVLNTTAGRSTLTLTTCNPRYSAATRLVVSAEFDGETATATTTTPTTHPKVSALAGEASAPSSSLGASSSPWTGAILWGLLSIAIVVGAYVLWRLLSRRGFRIVVMAIAVPLFLFALLVCFEHVSLALPGSF